MSEKNSIESQVTLLKSGDHQAFNVLYDFYYGKLYAVAFKYLKNEFLAEDAVQEIFIKLWNNRESIDDRISPKGFLFKSLKNHILNSIRNNNLKLIKNYEIAYNKASYHDDLEETILYNEYVRNVHLAIEKLSPQKRVIFKLKTDEGLNNEEVSKKLGLSKNTIKFQFSQASLFIRKYMKTHSGISIISMIVCYIF